MWTACIWVSRQPRRGNRGELKAAFGSQELQEESEGKMGKKQSGDDRGGSVAQERRRCQDG